MADELLSGAGGGLQGAAAGSVFGPWGAVAGGIIGGITGLFGASEENRRQRRIQSDLRKISGFQDQLIEEQLEQDAFNRRAQSRTATRNAAVAQSRMRAAAIASGAGLSSSMQAGQGAVRTQEAVARRDIRIGREATEKQLDIQRKIARREAIMRSR